jgi:hypothetical protein
MIGMMVQLALFFSVIAFYNQPDIGNQSNLSLPPKLAGIHIPIHTGPFSVEHSPGSPYTFIGQGRVLKNLLKNG